LLACVHMYWLQVQLAVQADAPPMVRSFGLVYVEMGISRAPPAEAVQAVRVGRGVAVHAICSEQGGGGGGSTGCI
jgi:hypothetical protein